MKMNSHFSITETKETDAHRRSHNNARRQWREANPVHTRYNNISTRFVGVDGEGITLPNGTHRYVLLGVGDQQITNPDGLSFLECIEFLWDNFETGSVAFVGFFLGYDFVQMFRSLPEERARMLLTREGKAKRKPKNANRVQPFPVEYEGWEFDILGTKRLKIRKVGSPRWMHVCDTGPYFQKSFLKVIDPNEWSDPVVTQEEYDLVAKGKSKRASASLDRDMLKYNALENEILSRVMSRLNEGFQSLGIHLRPGQWYGPGQAAQAWLETRIPNLQEELGIWSVPASASNITTEIRSNVQSTISLETAQHENALSILNAREDLSVKIKNARVKTLTNSWKKRVTYLTKAASDRGIEASQAWEAARKSYYGGWFEIMAHGLVMGGTWEYDINSAYPYIISTLPCLEHGEWIHNGPMDNSHYTMDNSLSKPTLVYAKVTGSNPHIGAMLHRDNKGGIFRPHQTEGWYWLHEIRAAQRAKLVCDDVVITDRWTYHLCGCLPPLREVGDIYKKRLDVGKKTPLGIACKLVPNSLYGKFAQSIGNPKYANPVYASLITAGCRTMILNAIASHPKGAESVLMVATDGVYFTSPHPDLPLSGNLGEWEEERKSDLLLFKPGVYWDNKTRASIRAGEAPVFKSRGVNARDFGKQLRNIDSQFGDLVAQRNHYEWWMTLDPDFWPRVHFPIEFSMITAVQALMRNDWDQAGTLIKNPTARQSSDPTGKRQDPYWDGRILRSHPRENDPYVPSEPYDKRFGMTEDPDNPFSQEARERLGVTRDGLPDLLAFEVLRSGD